MDTIQQHCPPAVVQKVAAADLAAASTNGLFSWVSTHGDLRCQVMALMEVARRIDARAHLSVVDDFCSSAATYARFLNEEMRARLRDAYQQMPYDASIHFAWFTGLRMNRIDIRAQHQGRIIENWSFTHPRRDAETWHYYLYLASLDTPGAYEKLADKIAATKDGNDATNLLKSFADLRTPQAKAILMLYANDPRRADGPERPELPISETIKLLLKQLY